MPNYTPSQVYDKYVALQKQLATNITNKGVTASQTELYDNLIDKVAQIENLKGEERTLENFTNVLDEPKSIVQLEYPDNTPKTLNAKLGSKNSFDEKQITACAVRGTVSNNYGQVTTDYLLAKYAAYGTGIYWTGFQVYLKANVDYTISADTYYATSLNNDKIVSLGVANEDYKFTTKQVALSANDIWERVSVTISVSQDGYYWLNVQPRGNATQYIDLDCRFKNIQIEIGSTATSYTPYISDFSTVNVIRCGKNILEYPYVETTLTRNGLTFTDNKDGTITVNGTATADTQFRLQDTVVYPNNFNPFNSIIGKQIYINGSPEGSSKDTYAIQWIQTGNFGNGIILEVQRTYYRFAIFIKSGITVENLVFKPQIIIGSENTLYEPYNGKQYTPTATGEVTGISALYPLTNLITNNAGVVFEEVTGQTYKEILPSTDKNGITKIWQPAVEETVVCDYLYDETTKTLTLLL